MSQTHSLKGHLAVSAIFVDRFGHSFQFGFLKFDIEDILMVFLAHSRVLGGGDLRELSFCGPIEPCLFFQCINNFA